MTDTPTYVACLTPTGTGAIATIAVRGPRAWEVVRDLFHPITPSPRHPVTPSLNHPRLGKFGEEAKDDVVLVMKQTDPAPWLELHCHGGQEVIRLFLETLERRDIRVCSWEELEYLTSGHPARALAAAALARAATVRTAAILLDQYHGALEQAVQRVIASLDANDTREASRILDELARWMPVGLHLTTPWKVVVAGAPNVGKSSLVNALAGYQRSVVAATPGTTRDLVTTLLAVDGWLIELTDTAGLRDDSGALEGQGIDRARAAVAETDCCLWVLDASAPPAWPEAAVERVQLVVNKIDLAAAWDLGQAAGAVQVSAKTGAGIPELVQSLARRLVPDPPPPGAPVPFLPWQCVGVEEARQFLAQGQIEGTRQVLRDLNAVSALPERATRLQIPRPSLVSG